MLSAYRGTTTLADGSLAGQGVVSRLGTPGGVIVDPSNPIGATFATFFTRGNHEHTIELVVETLHVSRTAARQHQLGHGQDITGTADLILTWTEDSTDYTATIADAAWESVDVKPTGAHTTATYRIKGGEWAITEGGDAVTTSILTGETLTPSAAGNSTLTLASGHRISSLLIQPAAGAGAYTHKVILPTTSRQLGDVVNARLEMPASANPTIEFRNATSGGTDLYSGGVIGMADAAVYELTFVFNGTAWRLQAYRNES